MVFTYTHDASQNHGDCFYKMLGKVPAHGWWFALDLNAQLLVTARAGCDCQPAPNPACNALAAHPRDSAVSVGSPSSTPNSVVVPSAISALP